MNPETQDKGSLTRVDGLAKVMGTTMYSDDIQAEDFGSEFLFGWPVTSTQAGGRVESFQLEQALASPGVHSVVTHENAPRLKGVTSLSMTEIGGLLPLQSPEVHYYGQCIAIVIADSLLAAQEGARLVNVNYTAVSNDVVVTLAKAENRFKKVKRAGIAPGKIERGDAENDYEQSALKTDHLYRCAPHHHNSIEPTSVIARWDPDGGLTVHAPVQWLHIDKLILGQAFHLNLSDRLPGFLARVFLGAKFEGKVRLSNVTCGGAFGRNINTIALVLAAAAAKVSGTAIKLVLSRQHTFTLHSHRGEVEQRLRLGADSEGQLQSMLCEPKVGKGLFEEYVEPVGEVPFQVYSHQSHFLEHQVAKLDLSGSGWMRAPGVSSAIFALESSMDELAHRLKMDPIELRLKNHADSNPLNGKPWSVKSLKECYRQGAEAIDWASRPQPGTLDEDGRLIGFGMASSFDMGRQFPASADIKLDADGVATVTVAAAEIGQGIWTALTQIAADALGLKASQIRLVTNHPKVPYAAGSIGSAGTFGNGTAIYEAAQKIKKALITASVRNPGSPHYRKAPATLGIIDGAIADPEGVIETVQEAMSRHPRKRIEKGATTGRTFGIGKMARAAFGAVFARISVDPILLDIRMEKLVGAFACGRILQPRIAENQLKGGMVWGLGQALFEESRVDQRTGQWTNSNLAEALIATQSDVGELKVIMVEEEDTKTHSLGMKGLGEIGVVGPAPAIANAYFHATGCRIRSLPMSLEHRIEAQAMKERS